MFSEYASRFLAQSQSQLSFSRTQEDTGRGLGSRQGSSSRVRQPIGNPYQPAGSQTSRFPFASRFSTTTAPAPLFYSATDDFREETDEEEHEREVADFYALQRSRRDFGLSRQLDASDQERDPGSRIGKSRRSFFSSRKASSRRVGGIRSSWTADDDTQTAKDAMRETAKENIDETFKAGADIDRLVDVDLASIVDNNTVEEAPREDSPPPIQHFRQPMTTRAPLSESAFLPRETKRADSGKLRPPSPDVESVPPEADAPTPGSPRHDAFWSTLFLTCLASVFATFTLICLHTSAPKNGGSLGDTIYTTMHSSFHLLAIDTLVATIVAFLWLAMLRSFVRPLVVLILIAVPTILFSFSVYPLVSSYKGSWHGSSGQDRAMRWLSIIPAAVGIFWTYTAYRGRHCLSRAIQILEFATRILGASPALVLVGFASLAAVVAWSWVWLLMFTRVFLGGHASGKIFVIDTSTWWLGVFFVLIYLWTLGVLSGLQRATTAATVSQWYFHRLATPSPSSQRVVHASFVHATSNIFGSICLSTLLSLVIRLPLLLLPRRFSALIAFCMYSCVPTSITTLTNPLTLTYAAIHSQSLTVSARGLSEMSFITHSSPTTTLTPRAFSQDNGQDGAPSLLAYRLAKLLLHATRFIASLAFGFGGWISTARMLKLSGAGYQGSLYAYVVGLIAGAIGWAVLGAMEGVLGGILDAVVVCWGSEVGSRGTGQARYCREAGELFGDQGSITV